MKEETSSPGDTRNSDVIKKLKLKVGSIPVKQSKLQQMRKV